MQEEVKNKIEPEEEQGIDILELLGKLWKSRKTLMRWGLAGAVIGLVVAFSIPKEYTTTVTLAPELGDSKSNRGGLSALAGMAGISLGNSGSDAVLPTLYPDVVSSVPFNVDLLDVEVESAKDKQKYTVKEFLEEKSKTPWWRKLMALPGKAIGGIMSLFRSDDEQEDDGDGKINPFRLNKKQALLIKALNNRISADVDKKTLVISVTTVMQDPLVSAQLADSVIERLQNFVSEYRTAKSVKDLEYAQKLNDEAKAEYYAAQQRLANYLDRNQGISLNSGRTTEERLRNEMNLAFNVYNTTAQQLQMAKAKVQEDKPVYTVIKPATVPIKPSKPSKITILFGWIFFAVVASAAWILYGKDALDKVRKSMKSEEEGLVSGR